jgi:hypothetical protein
MEVSFSFEEANQLAIHFSFNCAYVLNKTLRLGSREERVVVGVTHLAITLSERQPSFNASVSTELIVGILEVGSTVDREGKLRGVVDPGSRLSKNKIRKGKRVEEIGFRH